MVALIVGLAYSIPTSKLQRPRLGSDPEESMTVPEIVEYNGYPCEIHHVTTDDGYILELHRIPHGKNGEPASKGPLFLQHGLFSSSADWVANVADENLAFLLANDGYDVWMGNVRGNRYSRAHTHLDPDHDHDFWKFSFDEMGVHDGPAMIDYVLQQTDKGNLKYVGFSQGTLMNFILLSEKPEYAQKISHFHALAPVAYGGHIGGPAAIMAPFVNTMEVFTGMFGVDELFPSDEAMKIIGDTFCKTAPKLACENFIFILAGYDEAQMNATRLPVYVAHTPAGTSVQNLAHFAQLINSKHFQKFDFGAIENMVKYGQITPPKYDLSRITAPVSIYVGPND